MTSILQKIAVMPIHLYRLCLSPLIPSHCRFVPTCSEYALDAIAVHGAIKGIWLTANRILRCNPLCKGGLDPVPPAGTPVFKINLRHK